MKKIFLDLEMNPVAKARWAEANQLRREIIEIGAVMLDEAHAEIACFKRYIRPQFASGVAANITRLTAITDEDVRDADGFEKVLGEFAVWCEEAAAEPGAELTDGGDAGAADHAGEPAYEIYAWSDSDIRQLKQEMRAKGIAPEGAVARMLEHWRDFQRVYADMFYMSNVMSLTKALELSGLDFSGRAHDGLTDARNTADLYRQTQDSEQFARLKALIDEMQKPHTTALGDLVDLSGWDLPEG